MTQASESQSVGFYAKELARQLMIAKHRYVINMNSGRRDAAAVEFAYIMEAIDALSEELKLVL
jgi:hypothetical protein